MDSKSRPERTVYVVAPSHQHYAYWVEQGPLPPGAYRYVSDDYVLRGTHQPEVILLGRVWENLRWLAIKESLLITGARPVQP